MLMLNCNGPAALAALVLLHTKHATLSKEFVGLRRQPFVNVQQVGDERRWVVDGNGWTAGGTVAGMDIMGALPKSHKFELGDLPFIMCILRPELNVLTTLKHRGENCIQGLTNLAFHLYCRTSNGPE
jgi:hypothetical protein